MSDDVTPATEDKEEVENDPAFEFLAKTLAVATGVTDPVLLVENIGKTVRLVQILFEAARKDPEVTFAMVIRKGPNAAVLCVSDGQPLGPGENRRVLEPIISRC